MYSVSFLRNANKTAESMNSPGKGTSPERDEDVFGMLVLLRAAFKEEDAGELEKVAAAVSAVTDARAGLEGFETLSSAWPSCSLIYC